MEGLAWLMLCGVVAGVGAILIVLWDLFMNERCPPVTRQLIGHRTYFCRCCGSIVRVGECCEKCVSHRR